MATKKKPAKKTTKKTVKPRHKKPAVFADAYSEAARLIELDSEARTRELLTRGKGIVPLELLTGIRLFTPVQVWNGFKVPSEPTVEVASIGAYLVRSGMTADGACRAMGITLPEFRNWVERGVREIQAGAVDTPCARFVRIMDMADAQDELRDLTTINVQGGASGAQWKRERKSKERWGRQSTVGTTVNIVAGTKERDMDEMIPEAAEILYHLEKSGYIGLTITTETEVEQE